MAVARWSLLAKASWIARSSHSVSVTNSGLITIYGGELKPRTPVDAAVDASLNEVLKGSVHSFDLKHRLVYPQSESGWRTLPPTVSDVQADIPEARVGATTVWEDGYLFLWGGRGGVDMAPLEKAQAGIWCGDLKLGDNGGVKWERVLASNEDQAPDPRSYHTSVAYQGKIYIHAGCPISGRLNSLHSFDIKERVWKQLASAPEPPRGGTCLATALLRHGGPVLLRYGGFSGYELPSIPGSLDIYSISSGKWHSVQPASDPVHGNPGPRSVHGFAPFQSSSPSLADAVAVLYHGERDASSLGHAGAGTFWSDVWLLTKDAVAVETEGWAWRKIVVEGKNLPEGRGWFPSASWVDDSGNSHIVMHGGLLSSNERSDELWELRIN